MIWFCIYEAAKIVRFDPKTETFKEFALPNAKTKPYALGIATDGTIWYSSEWRDVMGRLDPATGQVTEYPMPYTDNGMRDFFLDKDGRIWFGTPPNNRVGYFYLAGKQRSAEAR
jgi:virginiamycin B lyase